MNADSQKITLSSARASGHMVFNMFNFAEKKLAAEMIYTGPKTMEEAKELDEIIASNAEVSRTAPEDRRLA